MRPVHLLTLTALSLVAAPARAQFPGDGRPLLPNDPRFQQQPWQQQPWQQQHGLGQPYVPPQFSQKDDEERRRQREMLQSGLRSGAHVLSHNLPSYKPATAGLPKTAATSSTRSRGFLAAVGGAIAAAFGWLFKRGEKRA
jgi:hypothetical protein